ncbi:hypothetical protein CF327_g3643 [Tilletia walkeri]|nr:hypothetical protein CF327_g3643 [Tilletia walkeri]
MIANTKLKPRGYRTPLSCFDPYRSVGPDKLVRLQSKSELSIMVKQLDKAVNGQQLWRLLNDAKFRSQKNLILVCNPCGPEAAHNHYTTPQAAKRHFFDHPMEAPLPAVPEIPLHLMFLALEKDWPMEIDWDEEAEIRSSGQEAELMGRVYHAGFFGPEGIFFLNTWIKDEFFGDEGLLDGDVLHQLKPFKTNGDFDRYVLFPSTVTGHTKRHLHKQGVTANSEMAYQAWWKKTNIKNKSSICFPVRKEESSPPIHYLS